MSIISEYKTQVYSKPNPGTPKNSDWFVPSRNQCHLCKTYGRKPIFKNIFCLYYHYSYKHKTELESEWRFRISQLLSEVRKQND